MSAPQDFTLQPGSGFIVGGATGTPLFGVNANVGDVELLNFANSALSSIATLARQAVGANDFGDASPAWLVLLAASAAEQAVTVVFDRAMEQQVVAAEVTP